MTIGTSSTPSPPSRAGEVSPPLEGGARPRPRHRTSWVRVVAELLLVAVALAGAATVLGPLVLPYRTYFVRSGSMRPSIPVGALAVYRPVAASELAPGDVIAFSRPGGAGDIVSHRIVKVEDGAEGRAFVTKGDANGTPDPWKVPAGAEGWRYSFHVPGVGYVVGVLGSTWGRLSVVFFVVLTGAVLALMAVWQAPPAGAGAPSGGEARRPRSDR